MAKVTRGERREHTASVREKLPQTGIAHHFSRLASMASGLMGSPWAFLTAVGIILVWAITGPIFNFSSDWQLYVNTGTTIVTFLMVFLIQNTQNRDARAIHLKLDELLRATPKARKEFMEAEEEDLDEIEREKAIVDRADPAPPQHRRNGNGKASAGGDRTSGGEAKR